MLEKIDSRLLRLSQTFCDTVQVHTGYSKFAVERWMCILVTIGFWSMWLMGDEAASSPGRWFLMFVNTIGWFGIALDASRREKIFLRNGTLLPHFWNSEFARHSFLFVTLLLFIFTIPLLFLNPDTLGMFILITTESAMLASVYAAICIPRPPRKSSLRSWYEGALWWLDRKLSPTPSS